jgi:hypothetical protein
MTPRYLFSANGVSSTGCCKQANRPSIAQAVLINSAPFLCQPTKQFSVKADVADFTERI